MTSLTLGASRPSFERFLRATGKSPRTIETYLISLDKVTSYLGADTDTRAVTRSDIEGWLIDLRASGLSPSSVSIRYRSLRAYFRWLADEGEIDANPCDRLNLDKPPEAPPPVLTEEQIAALLKQVSGRSFEDRRDAAMLRLLIDTGMRRGELAGMRVADFDLDNTMVRITGKGSRTRIVPYGPRTALAIDRYLRARERHPHGRDPRMWLGKRGVIKPNAILQMIRKRARAAGIGRLYTHMFRHTYAHRWLSAGGTEGTLMSIAGWRSREMLSRYGASAADARAIEAHRRLALGDKF